MDSRQHESSFETHGYELVAYYGGGQYGKAYLVRKKGTNELRIAKTVDLSEMVSNRDAALQEANLLLGYPHKNIVPCYEAYVQNDGYLVMIMEYCQGGDLARLLSVMRATKRRFSEAEIREMLRQLVSALAFIHDNCILHRDLKPSNILISSTGELKVADFGVARVLTGATCAAMTSAGTPNYMAPEMCKRRAYSYHSDMWSLGCILYEIMTLQTAFQGDCIIALAWCVCFENPTPVALPYSDPLKDILRMLLSKEPSERLLPKDLLKHDYFKLKLPPTAPTTRLDDELAHNVRCSPTEDNSEISSSEDDLIDAPMVFMKILIACQLKQIAPIACLVITHRSWPSIVFERFSVRQLRDVGFDTPVAQMIVGAMIKDAANVMHNSAISEGAVSGPQRRSSAGPTTAGRREPLSPSGRGRPYWVLQTLLESELSVEWLNQVGVELGVPLSHREGAELIKYFSRVMNTDHRTLRDLMSISRLNTHISASYANSEIQEQHASAGAERFDESELIVRLRWAANVILKSTGSITAEGTQNAFSALATNSNATINRVDFLRVMGVRFNEANNANSLAREMYKVSNKDADGNVDWLSTTAMLLKFTQHDGNPDQSQSRIIDSSLHRSIARDAGAPTMGDADGSEHNEAGGLTGIETANSSPPRPCTTSDFKKQPTSPRTDFHSSASTPSIRPSTGSSGGRSQRRAAATTSQTTSSSKIDATTHQYPRKDPPMSNEFWNTHHRPSAGNASVAGQSPLATLADQPSYVLYDQRPTRARVANIHSNYDERDLRGAAFHLTNQIHSIHSCDYGTPRFDNIMPVATRVTKSLQRGDWHRPADHREDPGGFMYYRGGGSTYIKARQPSLSESKQLQQQQQRRPASNYMGRRKEDLVGSNSGGSQAAALASGRMNQLKRHPGEYVSNEDSTNIGPTGYSPQSGSSGEPPSLRRAAGGGGGSQCQNLGPMMSNSYRRSMSGSSQSSSSSSTTSSSSSSGDPALRGAALSLSERSWYPLQYGGLNSSPSATTQNTSSRLSQQGNSSHSGCSQLSPLRRTLSSRLRALTPAALQHTQPWQGPPATYHILFNTSCPVDEDVIHNTRNSALLAPPWTAGSLITRLIVIGENLLGALKRTYLQDSEDEFKYQFSARTRRFEIIAEQLSGIRDRVKAVTVHRESARFLKHQINEILKQLSSLSWGRSTLDGVISGTRTVVTVLFELVNSPLGDVLETEVRRSILDQYCHRLRLYKEMRKSAFNNHHPAMNIKLLDWILQPSPTLLAWTSGADDPLIDDCCAVTNHFHRRQYNTTTIRSSTEEDDHDVSEDDHHHSGSDGAVNDDLQDPASGSGGVSNNARRRIRQPYRDVVVLDTGTNTTWPAQQNNPQQQSQPRDPGGADMAAAADQQYHHHHVNCMRSYHKAFSTMMRDQRPRMSNPSPEGLVGVAEDGYMFSRVSRTASNEHPTSSTAMHRRRGAPQQQQQQPNDPIYPHTLLSARRQSALTSDIHYLSTYDDEEVANNIRADRKIRSKRHA